MYISTDCGGGLMCWSLRWWRCWWRSTPAYVPPAQYSLSRPSCDPIKSKGFDVNPSWPSHRNTSLTINTLNLRDCQHRLNEGSSLCLLSYWCSNFPPLLLTIDYCLDQSIIVSFTTHRYSVYCQRGGKKTERFWAVLLQSIYYQSGQRLIVVADLNVSAAQPQMFK